MRANLLTGTKYVAACCGEGTFSWGLTLVLCLYNGCYSVTMSKCFPEISTVGFFLLLAEFPLYSEMECSCKNI